MFRWKTLIYQDNPAQLLEKFSYGWNEPNLSLADKKSSLQFERVIVAPVGHVL